MHLPRAYEDLASSQYCNKWDQIFRPNKKCLPIIDAANPSPTEPTAAKGVPTDAVVVVVIIGLIVLAVLITLLYACFDSLKKRHQKRARARARRASLSQPPTQPNARERRRRPTHDSGPGLSSWWSRFRSQRGAGAPDAEMGRLKRAFSRVRSIAKTNPEITTLPPLPRMGTAPPTPYPHPDPNQHIPPSYISRNLASRSMMPSAHRIPRYAPPGYDFTPRGSPIADSFASRSQRGDERVGTPPPTYQQRTADWHVWEVDGTPAPEYTYFGMSSQMHRG
ncbi:hypothetical protein EG329_001264 [Mollisiaceae sp. DMI_Dod_QoI]|nr:hypothetical protein EG329_001264 [Helotiales sp. DMI_Dod_QoI]